MKGVSFLKVHGVLPARCIGLMQNPSPQEQSELGRQIAAIAANKDLADQDKAYLLGLALLNVVGESVLRSTLDTIGAENRG